MKKFIKKFLPYMIFGSALGIVGFHLNDWEYWVVFIAFLFAMNYQIYLEEEKSS